MCRGALGLKQLSCRDYSAASRDLPGHLLKMTEDIVTLCQDISLIVDELRLVRLFVFNHIDVVKRSPSAMRINPLSFLAKLIKLLAENRELTVCRNNKLHAFFSLSSAGCADKNNGLNY